jgi:hypothetical protein
MGQGLNQIQIAIAIGIAIGIGIAIAIVIEIPVEIEMKRISSLILKLRVDRHWNARQSKTFGSSEKVWI